METFNFTLIKSHNNTSNIYVKRAIILQNIKSIKDFQQSTPRPNITTRLWFELASHLKKQHKYLKDLNVEIDNIEQLAFHFGGPIPNKI